MPHAQLLLHTFVEYESNLSTHFQVESPDERTDGWMDDGDKQTEDPRYIPPASWGANKNLLKN